jgi:hypothetical protein
MGLVPGCKLLRKFGDNEAVPGGGVTTDVWPHTIAGANRRVLPAAAGVVSTVSTDADDNGTGAGMQQMTIEGLDTNLLEISETVTLTGLTPVVTTKQFLRVNRMYGVASGASETNEGDIKSSIGGNVQGVIEALEGQTHQAVFTVPANMWLHVTDFEISVGRMATSADMHAFGEIKVFGQNTWRTIENVYMTGGQNFGTHRPTVMFPPGTDMRVSAHADSVTQMSAMFGGVLIETNMLGTMGSWLVPELR